MAIACTRKEDPMHSVLLFIHTLVGGETQAKTQHHLLVVRHRHELAGFP